MSSFVRLVRHFANKIVRGGDASAGFDIEPGGLLGLLTAPGAFICFILFDKYSPFLAYLRGRQPPDPYTDSVPDKYLLIVFAMAITGVVTVLKWDRILPDRQDHLNLAPLPIPASTLFAASCVAVLFVTGVFALAVNGMSIVLYPAFLMAGRTGGEALQFAAVHAACVLLATAFAFSAALAAAAILELVVPPRLFRPVSLMVRAAILAGLFAILLTSFSGEALARRLHQAPDSWVSWLPPLWFTGLYQMWQGRATRELEAVGSLALHATGFAVFLAAAGYSLSYRRTFLRATEVVTPSRRAAPWPRLRILRWLPKGHPLLGGAYPFAIRTLLRSDAHSLCVGVFFGLGAAVGSQVAAIGLARRGVAQALLPSSELLAPPLVIAYLLICGVRLACEIPAELPANWVFQLSGAAENLESRTLARCVILSCVATLVVIPAFAVYTWFYGWRVGALHSTFILTLSFMLTEALLLRYGKIPFTCSLPPLPRQLLFLCALHVVGVTVFATEATRFESWMLKEAWRLVLVLALLPAGWLLRRLYLADVDVADRPPIFEAHPEAAVERLGLDGLR